MSWVCLGLSEKFDGQFAVTSNDPMFLFAFGDRGWFAQDGTIVNQDMCFDICNEVSQLYELVVTPEAAHRLSEVMDDSVDLFSKSFTPPDWYIPKKFQVRCINNLKTQDVGMIQCSCGCGKSSLAMWLGCLKVDEGKVDRIVIWCPSALITDWVSNIKEFTQLSVATVNRSWSAAKRDEFYKTCDAQVLVLNYERVRTGDFKSLISLVDDRWMFVFDEVTKLKNRKSQNHKNMAKLVKKVGYRLALTATPVVTGPEDFYNEWRILKLDAFGRVKDFERDFTYGNGEKDIWGNYIGYKDLELMQPRVGRMMFSADKSRPEIACEFPERNEILMRLELSDKDRALYRALMDYGHSLDEREGALFFDVFKRVCNMPQVLLGMKPPKGNSPYAVQARRIAEICQAHAKDIDDSQNSAKLALVIEKVDQIISSGEKVIIFAEHTNNCLIPLAQHLSKIQFPLMYHGGMTQNERDESIRRFMSDEREGLLLMSDAGQMGLNLQVCRNVIHYQTPITHAAYTQRADRAHRISSEFQSIDVYRMVTEGTIEERVEDTMQGRKKLAEQMGMGGEYEEYGTISNADADWLCGF